MLPKCPVAQTRCCGESCECSRILVSQFEKVHSKQFPVSRNVDLIHFERRKSAIATSCVLGAPVPRILVGTSGKTIPRGTLSSWKKLIENKNRCRDDGCPETAFVAHRRLRHVCRAYDLI